MSYQLIQTEIKMWRHREKENGMQVEQLEETGSGLGIKERNFRWIREEITRMALRNGTIHVRIKYKKLIGQNWKRKLKKNNST